VLECWSVGVLECWSVGVLECWSVGVLECWSADRRHPISKCYFALTNVRHPVMTQIPIQEVTPDVNKRILVVEDHPLFRERLTQLINNEPDLEVAGQTGTAKDAIQLILNSLPALAIVDITLQGTSGLELIKSIKALSINLPVLVLSMHDESLYAERALRAGAAGYITKNHGAGEVLLAIRQVLAGEIYLSPQITSGFLKRLASPGAKNTPNPVDRLTDRELEVLVFIGRGLTTRRIAERLGIGVVTIDTYRARIKEKMNFGSGTELQHFAIRWVSERE
jgi:DNA-binding NarL/FixJ family response regulator